MKPATATDAVSLAVALASNREALLCRAYCDSMAVPALAAFAGNEATVGRTGHNPVGRSATRAELHAYSPCSFLADLIEN